MNKVSDPIMALINHGVMCAITPDKACFSTVTKLVLKFALNYLTIECFLISPQNVLWVLTRSAYIQLGSVFVSLIEVLQPSQPIKVMAAGQFT